MTKDNYQKIKEIDNILDKYKTKMFFLRKKRDEVISNFLNKLKDRKIQEVRDSIKKL